MNVCIVGGGEVSAASEIDSHDIVVRFVPSLWQGGGYGEKTDIMAMTYAMWKRGKWIG